MGEIGVVEKYKVKTFFQGTISDVVNLQCFFPDDFDIRDSILNLSGGSHELTNIPVT